MEKKRSISLVIGGYFLSGVLIVLMSMMVDNTRMGHALWRVPYFSGAANYSFGAGWRYNPEDVARFEALPTQDARAAYRFEEAEDEALVPYNYQPIGFMYVNVLTRQLFFWQGDVQAAETLLIVLHIFLTFLFMHRLRRCSSKILFFLLYGLNPLMLYFATMPWYRYWPALASAPVALYLLDRRLKVGWVGGLTIAVFLGLMYAVRPTVLFICIFFGVLVALRESKVLGLVCIAVFLISATVVFNGNDHIKNPWYAAYTGVAGYPNPYIGYGITDALGIQAFERETGIAMWDEDGLVMEQFQSDAYWDFTKTAYLEILQTDPLLLLRNAVLNVFQTFSLGYFMDSLALSYVSAFLGFLYFLLLGWHRKYLFILAIALSALTFTPYMVPTQALMFGTFILLVASFIDLLRDYPVVERLFNTIPG